MSIFKDHFSKKGASLLREDRTRLILKSGDTSKSMESGTNKYFIEIKQVLINISLGWSEKKHNIRNCQSRGRAAGWVGGASFRTKAGDYCKVSYYRLSAT